MLLFLLIISLLFNASYQLSLTKPEHGNCITWFRNHALRINDNEALCSAMNDCGSSSNNNVFPIYLWETNSKEGTVIDEADGGTASELFVAHALDALNDSLNGTLTMGFIECQDKNEHDSSDCTVDELISERAHAYALELSNICHHTHSSQLYYITSNDIPFEKKLVQLLNENGITVHAFSCCSLLDYSMQIVPWKEIILNHPFRSPLIPFVDYVLKNLEKSPPKEPTNISMNELLPILKSLSPSSFTNSLDVNSLLQTIGKTSGGTEWGSSIITAFPPNHDAAKRELMSFLDSLGNKSKEKKTHFASRLSPYLARGIFSAREVYQAISSCDKDVDSASLTRRLCWRDYTYAVVALFPDVLYGYPIREGYNEYYETNVSLDKEKRYLLDSWKKGKTGIPIVDAGMRQLIAEGFMPQKVRLVTSTYLVEGLGISWREGMKHFKEYLVDYDEAINNNMWMNAGCVGLDPYYCGMKYKKRSYWDSNGSYIRHFCPELKNLPDWMELDLGRGVKKKVDVLYEPWLAPSHVLESSGVVLGETYPSCNYDDRVSRTLFFERLRNIRQSWSVEMIDDSKRDIVPLGRNSAADRVGLFTPRVLHFSAR